MSNNFKVKVNQIFEFNIDAEQASSLDSVTVSKNEYHTIQNNQSYKVAIVNSNFNKKNYVIKVNNTNYNISISNSLDLLIKEMGFALASSKNIDSIKAPMPGLLLDVKVKVGQEIKEDDALMILEAMKMENVITSPRDGIIKSVKAKKGNTVEKGALLIEFES